MKIRPRNVPNVSSKPTLILFGSSGMIGAALHNTLQLSGSYRIRCISHNENIREADVEENALCVFAGGLTRPNLSWPELKGANLDFVQRNIEKLQNRKRKFFTFGTVMENFQGMVDANLYIRSKFELGKFIEKRDDAIHVRLHTAYGPRMQTHLFLGQMLNALKKKTVFEMSAGDQLREFHRVEDVAHAMKQILSEHPVLFAEKKRLLTVSTGRPLRLKAVAERVFASIDLLSLLKIGQIQGPLSENTEVVFERSSENWVKDFRTGEEPIVEFFRSQI